MPNWKEEEFNRKLGEELYWRQRLPGIFPPIDRSPPPDYRVLAREVIRKITLQYRWMEGFQYVPPKF